MPQACRAGLSSFLYFLIGFTTSLLPDFRGPPSLYEKNSLQCRVAFKSHDHKIRRCRKDVPVQYRHCHDLPSSLPASSGPLLARSGKVRSRTRQASHKDCAARRLNKPSLNRSRFFPMHQHSTVKQTDRICVIDHDHLIEHGNHTEPIACNDAPTKLCGTTIAIDPRPSAQMRSYYPRLRHPEAAPLLTFSWKHSSDFPNPFHPQRWWRF